MYITRRYTPAEGSVFQLNYAATGADGGDPRPGVPLPGSDLAGSFAQDRVALLADGRLALLVNYRLDDRVKSTIYLIGAKNGQVEKQYSLEQVVYDMSWSADGNWLVYAAENGVYVLDFPAALQGTVSAALLYDGRAEEVELR
jgi:hypothetical protein